MINKIKKHGLQILMLVFLFLGLWLLNGYFNKSELESIQENLRFTSGQIRGQIFGATRCRLEYIYVVNGAPYRGLTQCNTEYELCSKYLLAYSSENPGQAVLLIDYELNDNLGLGEVVKPKEIISTSMLKKWIENEPTKFEDYYIYPSQEYLKDDRCN